MDFLNKAVAQLAELLRSMTPAARITAGLLLLVVVVSVGYLFNHQMSGPDELLFGGEAVSADQIPSMEGAFAKANLSGYQIDGGRIRVPRGQRAQYVAALVDGKALPQTIGGMFNDAIERGGIFGTTRPKQEELHMNALQNELQLVIRKMRGIESASVILSSQAGSGFAKTTIKTASVSVKPTGNQPLEEDRVPMLRQFVAAAMAGLSPESVAVTDLNTGRTYAGDNASGGGGAAGITDRYRMVKRQLEHDWEENIRKSLSYIPGIVVGINVDLEPVLSLVESKTTFDNKTPTIEREEITSNNSSNSGGSGGRPGVAAQGANQAASVSGGGAGTNHSQQDTSNVKERNLAAPTYTEKTNAPLAPQRVTVSLAVPSSYIEKLWQERNPSPPGQEPKKPDRAALLAIEKEESDKLQTHVGFLIPQKETKDSRNQVTVTVFQQLPTDPLPSPSMADQALSWLGQSWTTLGMGLLGVFGLVMLRSMVRPAAGSAAPTSSAPSAAAVANAAAAAEEEAATESDTPPAEAAPRRKRRVQTGPNLKDDLVEIVREDPDAAANILRSWIGSGA